MNSQISQISEIMEDIKEKISDNEYKIIMDNLMKFIMIIIIIIQFNLENCQTEEMYN